MSKQPPKSAAEPGAPPRDGQRIAKLLARAGVASRREIERMIEQRRVAIDGVAIETPATILTSLRGVTVDDEPVEAPAASRLFRFHKPTGLLTAERDPEGRATIYDKIPADLPRLMPIGRLDLNTEGLLLLTNDGELKRQLELPATGVERTYRARAYGAVSQAQLEDLIEGIEIDGIRYGSIDANLERRTGTNVWIEMRLTEGKNREVRHVLEHLGLQVSRLIRTSYGPYALEDLPSGAIEEVLQHDLVAFKKLLATIKPQKGAKLERRAPSATPAAPPPTAPRAQVPRPDMPRREAPPRPTSVSATGPRPPRPQRADAPRRPTPVSAPVSGAGRTEDPRRGRPVSGATAKRAPEQRSARPAPGDQARPGARWFKDPEEKKAAPGAKRGRDSGPKRSATSAARGARWAQENDSNRWEGEPKAAAPQRAPGQRRAGPRDARPSSPDRAQDPRARRAAPDASSPRDQEQRPQRPGPGTRGADRNRAPVEPRPAPDNSGPPKGPKRPPRPKHNNPPRTRR